MSVVPNTPDPLSTPVMLPDRDAFLFAMRQVASSVTVVTTDGPAGLCGATVSAFSSVSAEPPTVLVCLRSDSRIAAGVKANGVYCVNVLPEERADLARAFAGQFDGTRSDRFEGVPLTEHKGTAPGIVGATTFACRLVKVVEQHSHTICIGEVVSVAAEQRFPLTYHNGAFRRLCVEA